MHRIGAYLFGLLFSGGTVMAVGSLLGSIRRSMFRPLTRLSADNSAVAGRPPPAELHQQPDQASAKAVPVLPAPESQTAEISWVSQVDLRLIPVEQDCCGQGALRPFDRWHPEIQQASEKLQLSVSTGAS
jgi:hypothetical protein